MKACARGWYSNEFDPSCVGKTRLVGMSLVSVMNKRFAGAWHIACTINLAERGAQKTRQVASDVTAWRGRFLRREGVLPAYNKGLHHNTLREGCVDNLVWRVLST